MKSDKKLIYSNINKELKEEYKDGNLNDSNEENEELSIEEETEKTKEIKNNNENKNKKLLKYISKNNSVNNINSKICNHNITDNISENSEIKNHQRCVPLEIYTKVYKDKQTLISQVEILSKEINSFKSNMENEEIKILDNKFKNLQREKTNIENVLLNQEKYVTKLKKKIQNLENQILKKNEELVIKDNTITELNDKIEDLNNKIINIKQNYKISEKKEIMKLNDKIINLYNEIEIKQSKIDFIDKRHKNLQLKYLKLLGDKRKMAQESMSIYKYNKEKNLFSENTENNTTRNKFVESVRSYNSIKKNENYTHNNNIKIKEKDLKKLKLNQEIHLPEILKSINNKKSFSTHKEKNNDKNNALKDLNMLLSNFTEKEDLNKNEEMEEQEEEDIDNKLENSKSEK